MPVRRCEAPGCGRFVRSDQAWCPAHHPAARWRGSDEADDNAETELLERVASEFRRRMEQGAYRELLGPNISALIQEAAQEHGISDEIGILRVALAKLLLEEEDAAQLAAGVARVAAISIQAARTRRAIEGDTAGSLLESVTHILTELGLGE
jgi:hypothetical protein